MGSIYYFNITYKCNNSCIFCAADLAANNDGPEISLASFDQFLREKHVGAGDRVIINGGEPTVHRDFFCFLEKTSQTGALIDLFTNGKLLAESSFAAKVLSYSPIHIRIPLFGATASVHDSLTGFKGNFDKTLSAIRNVVEIVRETSNARATLEVKMLLSKVTVPENEGILTLLNESFPSRPFEISLNPLLISDCVLKQSETFVASYRDLMKQSVSVVTRAMKLGWCMRLSLIPLCVYPEELAYLIPNGGTKKKFEVYTDPMSSFDVREKQGFDGCARCALKDQCNKFPDNYLQHMGCEEIVPYQST